MRFLNLVVLLLFMLLAACRKDGHVSGTLQGKTPSPPTDTTAHLAIFEFRAFCNDTPLTSSEKRFTNLYTDTFSVKLFNYYVSNVKLHGADGVTYTEPESYHIIKQFDGLTTMTLAGIPAGTYTAASFMIGVDSLRNVSGAQSGALDPGHLMFWDWNTGYIFYKLEGEYKSYTGPSGEYAIHVGGFSGEENCIRTVTVTMTSPVISKQGTKSYVEVHANAGQVFDGPGIMSFDDYFAALPNGPRIFQQVADNYRHMFTVSKVENRSN